MKTVLKVLAALAAVAGVIYVIAAYGDKIVATCKKLLAWCSDESRNTVIIESDFAPETTEEAPEAPAEEPESAPAEAEETADETSPVADEDDFEG